MSEPIPRALVARSLLESEVGALLLERFLDLAFDLSERTGETVGVIEFEGELCAYVCSDAPAYLAEATGDQVMFLRSRPDLQVLDGAA